jgi:hypothetical protein
MKDSLVIEDLSDSESEVFGFKNSGFKTPPYLGEVIMDCELTNG